MRPKIGMADVAALFPDGAYAEAIEAIWRAVAKSKVYITGCIGARHKGEAFGAAFELPNRTAYAETCTSIGSVMWNHRLFLLTGESIYMDAAEQTLYNGVLSGVSLSGEEFFYVNPLESDGKLPFNHGSAGRQPWFDVSCCPTGICRFLTSLPGYVYATTADPLYVNLFISGNADVDSGGTLFHVSQETDYPWNGTARLTVRPEKPARLRLLIRVPGWARGRIMGGSLYRYEQWSDDEVALRVNDSVIDPVLEKGYAVVDREWRDGDVIECSFPMPVRKVVCDPRAADNHGKAAIQRGPIVYCVEARDAELPMDEISLPEESRLASTGEPGLLGGITAVRGKGFVAIPSWANRGAGQMRVWHRNGG